MDEEGAVRQQRKSVPQTQERLPRRPKKTKRYSITLGDVRDMLGLPSRERVDLNGLIRNTECNWDSDAMMRGLALTCVIHMITKQCLVCGNGAYGTVMVDVMNHLITEGLAMKKNHHCNNMA